MFRHSKWRAHLVGIRFQEGEDAGLCTTNMALMHVAEGVVQWPKSVEVSGCDGLDAATRFEHAHAFFGETKVRLDTVCLAIKEFSRAAVEENNRSCERPVAVMVILVRCVGEVRQSVTYMIIQQRLVNVPSKAINRRIRAMARPAIAHSFRKRNASPLEKEKPFAAPPVS